MDLVPYPDEKLLRAELEKAKHRLVKQPGSWVWLEQISRILRWLDDPTAGEYFDMATENYKIWKNSPGDYMRLGNLYRLKGDTRSAIGKFQTAHEMFAKRVYGDKQTPMDIEHMIPASFLIENDDEAAELINRLRSIDSDTELIAYPIAKLSVARRDNDEHLAYKAIEEFSWYIKRYRSKIWNTGGVLPWDWYEIGMEVWRSILPQNG